MVENRFGRIVHSLRLERFDEEGGPPWRQEELAQASGLSIYTIRNIEQGRRATLQAEELELLASALALSPPEALEFFAAASEASIHQPTRSQEPSPAVDLFTQIASIRLPAYIVDPFSTLLAINGPMMAIGGYERHAMDAFLTSPVGANVLDMLFRPDAPIQQSRNSHWEQVTVTILQFFRTTVLRYRHLPQFETLIEHLHHYAGFASLWRSSRQSAPALPTLSPGYDYYHPEYSTLQYIHSFFIGYSTNGPRYIIVLIPTSGHTGDIFHHLARQEDPLWHNPGSVAPEEG